MHIFLIRHGQSMTNSGDNYDQRLPDHLVRLTDEGIRQAYEGGVWLKDYCEKKGIDLESARIWRSPYQRTRQTCDEFNRSLGIRDIKEDITLTEQQFGVFDAVPKEEWLLQDEKGYDEYLRQVQNHGKFYARMPMGESPYDVAIRVHQFMGTIYRDVAEEGEKPLFIFSHGTTIRTFLLRWFHYSPEWYEAEHNPKNCWIREIDGSRDLGYINAPEKNKE